MGGEEGPRLLSRLAAGCAGSVRLWEGPGLAPPHTGM